MTRPFGCCIFWDPDVRIGYLLYFGTRGVSLNVNCGSDFFFLLYLVVMASIVLSLNGNCIESWRELGRHPADTLWFALGRSGGVTHTRPLKIYLTIIEKHLTFKQIFTTFHIVIGSTTCKEHTNQ